MTADDKARLTAERDAIEKRLATAPQGPARTALDAQFGERLLHLKARLEDPAEAPAPEPQTSAVPTPPATE